MPSHTIPSTLIKLYHTKGFAGAPWIFPTWQDITGVYDGLFPINETKLPKRWTPEVVASVRSYFDQYESKRNEDEKIKFACTNYKAKTNTIPG